MMRQWLSKGLERGFQSETLKRIVWEHTLVSKSLLGLSHCLIQTLKQTLKGKSKDDTSPSLLYALSSTTILLSYASQKVFQSLDHHQLVNLLSLVYATLDLRLKCWILRLTTLILNRVYFEPASQSLFASDSLPLADEAHWQGLCDLLFDWFHACPKNTPLVYLQNAPLLVDLDIAVGILDRFQDSHDARWDHLSKAMLALHQSAGTWETQNRFKHANASRNARGPCVASARASSGAPAGASYGLPFGPSYRPTDATDETFIHMTLLISQVKDLFPELGEGFIEACLEEYQNDTETVIMKVLEGELTARLQSLDKKMIRSLPLAQPVIEPFTPSLLASRKNVFDGDAFDVFSKKIDTSNVVFGKKECVFLEFNLDRKSTLNPQEENAFKQSQKSRILEYQFDDYDDEYDDTYDSNDIKLADATEIDALDTPDPTNPSSSASEPSTPDPGRLHEYLLVQSYTSDPALFISSRRKTSDRAHLKSQTGLSDEQIEGWAKMLERNPRKEAILQKYEWRGNKNEQEAAQSLESFGIGETKENNKTASTARQRQLGQRNKARGANHNRKKGHDKKMDRGMMGGS